AQQAHLGAALHLAVGDVAAGHHAHAGDAEHIAHLGLAQLHFLELGSQHTLHGGLDLVDAVVDHAVHPHIHLVAGGSVLGVGVGTDVEAHDDGVGGGSQHDVALVDGAHRAVDDPHPD